MTSEGWFYNKVIGFSSREYHKFSTASLITRCTNDIQQIQQVMAMMFRIVLYAPILGIGGVIRVLQRDSSMTWILGGGHCTDHGIYGTAVQDRNAEIYSFADHGR